MSPVPLSALRKGLAGAPRPTSNPARVLALLAKDPRQAWRAKEIADRLSLDQHTLGAVLRRLHARGLVEKEGLHWYALPQREVARRTMALAAARAAEERLGAEPREDWARVDHP